MWSVTPKILHTPPFTSMRIFHLTSQIISAAEQNNIYCDEQNVFHQR